jgi:hypothetical protein
MEATNSGEAKRESQRRKIRPLQLNWKTAIALFVAFLAAYTFYTQIFLPNYLQTARYVRGLTLFGYFLLYAPIAAFFFLGYFSGLAHFVQESQSQIAISTIGISTLRPFAAMVLLTVSLIGIGMITFGSSESITCGTIDTSCAYSILWVDAGGFLTFLPLILLRRSQPRK